jgi:hypothetical protein
VGITYFGILNFAATFLPASTSLTARSCTLIRVFGSALRNFLIFLILLFSLDFFCFMESASMAYHLLNLPHFSLPPAFFCLFLAFSGDGVPYDWDGTPNGTPEEVRRQCDVDRADNWGVPDGTDSYTLANFGWIMKQTGKFTVDTFYAHDANAIDARCWWNETTQVCEKPGEGLVGGPSDHQGRGCHAHTGVNDQIIALAPDGTSLVTGEQCQCSTGLIGTDADAWVEHWLNYADPERYEIDGKPSYPGFTYFQGANRNLAWNEPGGKNGKAASGDLDVAICWTPDVDSMVKLQNSLWQMRRQWYNGLVPLQPEKASGPDSVEGMKYWYGWNEVPMLKQADKRKNADAWLIKLPANTKKLEDLSKEAIKILRNDVQGAMSKTQGYDGGLTTVPKSKRLTLNDKKKSRVILLIEKYKGDEVWERKAKCQDFVFNKKKPNQLRVEFKPGGKNNNGYCYLAGNLKAGS